MNIATWIASGLLAAAYLFVGGTKLLTPKERLAKNPSMWWKNDTSSGGLKLGSMYGCQYQVYISADR